MRVTRKRLLTLKAGSSPRRPKFLCAASGLVRDGEFYYVVADDELHLGVFPVAGSTPGTLQRLLPGKLVLETKARKKRKPDLEALVLIPAQKKAILLAVPSGSRPNRRIGATLTGPVDFSSLYKALEKELPGTLNIEGACVRGDELILAQRGNSKHGANALITLDLDRVRKALGEKVAITKKAIKAVKTYRLGRLGGVPLTFTDLAALPDGTLVFSAAAEATDDPYGDAPFTGSVIGLISATGKLVGSEPLSKVLKVEGLHAELRPSGIAVTFVTDADDPTVPAGLYACRLKRIRPR